MSIAELLRDRRARRFERSLVWVLGSPRSGSTWLWSMLADVRGVVPVNEPQIGHHLAPFLSDRPGFDPDLLDVDTFTMQRLRRDRGQYFFAEQYREAWLPALRTMIDRRFLAHAERHATARLADTRVVLKEPNGSQAAPLLMAAQPEARLLFLLRDGRDVVDSELAANLEGSWGTDVMPGHRGIRDDERLAFVVQSAHKWCWRTGVVTEAFDAHPGPKLLVRYEDLLESTTARLAEIVAWMDLEVDRATLEGVVEAHGFDRIDEQATGDTAFHRRASPGSWRTSLRDEERAELTRIVADTLRSVGYT